MKTRIIKILFILLLFSAKIFLAAEMEEEQDPPLMDAIGTNKSFEKIKSLVEKNANVDECKANGFSALMLATGKDRRDVVEFLVDHKANVNKTNNCGHSALCLANLEIQAVLEKNGAEDPHLTEAELIKKFQIPS